MYDYIKGPRLAELLPTFRVRAGELNVSGHGIDPEFGIAAQAEVGLHSSLLWPAGSDGYDPRSERMELVLMVMTLVVAAILCWEGRELWGRLARKLGVRSCSVCGYSRAASQDSEHPGGPARPRPYHRPLGRAALSAVHASAQVVGRETSPQSTKKVT